MFQQHEKRNFMKGFRSLLIGGLLFGGLQKMILTTHWAVADPNLGDYSMRGIGKALLSSALLPFEAVSLILLVAIIGALLISSTRNEK